MNIENQINESIKDSMKKKDSLRLESLRSIKSAILLEKTKFSSDKTLDDDEIIKILQRLVKQRNDSAKIYKEQNREDLAEVELMQSNIYKEYLPMPVSDEELEAEINKIISDLGANGMKDMGKVMGELKKQHADEIDFSKAGALIKQLLNK